MTPDERWRELVQSLPAAKGLFLDSKTPVDNVATAELARSRTDEELCFSHVMSDLPLSVVTALRTQDSQTDDIDRPPLRVANWCLADMPEGDFPRVYVFSTLRGLVSAIASREGRDTAVWPFYGFPLRLTRAVPRSGGTSQRYLQLDPRVCVAVSSSGELVPLRNIDVDSIGIEEEGWLGDPAMRRSEFFHSKIVDHREEEGDREDGGSDSADESGGELGT